MTEQYVTTDVIQSCRWKDLWSHGADEDLPAGSPITREILVDGLGYRSSVWDQMLRQGRIVPSQAPAGGAGATQPRHPVTSSAGPSPAPRSTGAADLGDAVADLMAARRKGGAAASEDARPARSEQAFNARVVAELLRRRGRKDEADEFERLARGA